MVAAIFISIICHILCFEGIDPTFTKSIFNHKTEFSRMVFLGQILQQTDYHIQPTEALSDLGEYTSNAGSFAGIGYSIGRLSTKIFIDTLDLKPSWIPQASLNMVSFEKPAPFSLSEYKIIFFEPIYISKPQEFDSSIMFHPTMPYHFLLYFKDRQTAHVEVDFYISDEGEITRIKRRISSGNPEVDLLIMRNLVRFINLCKTNFALGSWRTLKIDLSP